MNVLINYNRMLGNLTSRKWSGNTEEKFQQYSLQQWTIFSLPCPIIIMKYLLYFLLKFIFIFLLSLFYWGAKFIAWSLTTKKHMTLHFYSVIEIISIFVWDFTFSVLDYFSQISLKLKNNNLEKKIIGSVFRLVVSWSVNDL